MGCVACMGMVDVRKVCGVGKRYHWVWMSGGGVDVCFGQNGFQESVCGEVKLYHGGLWSRMSGGGVDE
jgi:hypothetical protein